MFGCTGRASHSGINLVLRAHATPFLESVSDKYGVALDLVEHSPCRSLPQTQALFQSRYSAASAHT